MQYYLHYNRRLRRHSICSAGSNNKSECQYNFSTGASPLCIGGTATYTANGVVLGGGTGAWSSSNPAVATVSAAGLVTGVSAGTCNIIYTITGGCGGTVSAQQSVTINPNASITSVTGTTPLCIGGTATYTANGVVLRRRHRSLEQQQPCSGHGQCCRIGDRSISRHMQYYLYDNRRLRRNSISPASSDNKSECKYHLSNRYNAHYVSEEQQPILPTEWF